MGDKKRHCKVSLRGNLLRIWVAYILILMWANMEISLMVSGVNRYNTATQSFALQEDEGG